MRLPQLPVVEIVDAFPEARFAGTLGPVGAEVPVVHLAHLRSEPALEVHAIGDVADRDAILAATGEQRPPHGAGDLAMHRGYGVGPPRRLEGKHRHAEVLVCVAGIDAAERHQGVSVQPQRFAKRAQVLFDQRLGKPIVAGRHRSMGGENDLPGDAAQRLGGVDAFERHAVAHELQGGKRAVPLVQMKDARSDPHGVQRAHAADAKQQFLPDPHAVVAAVEPRRQLTVLRAVSLDVRIEQEEGVPADSQLPDTRENVPGPRFD